MRFLVLVLVIIFSSYTLSYASDDFIEEYEALEQSYKDNELSPKEICTERWNYLWPKVSNQSHDMARLALYADSFYTTRIFPGYTSYEYNLQSPIFTLGIHALASNVMATEYQNGQSYYDVSQKVLEDFYRQFKLRQSLQGTRYIKCMEAPYNGNYKQCADNAVRSGLVMPFEDFIDNINNNIEDGGKSICANIFLLMADRLEPRE